MAHRNLTFLAPFQNVWVTPHSYKIREVNIRFFKKRPSGLRDLQFDSLLISCSSVGASMTSLEISLCIVVTEGDRIWNILCMCLCIGYWCWVKTLLEGSFVQMGTLVSCLTPCLTHCSWNSEMQRMAWGSTGGVSCFYSKGKTPTKLVHGNQAVFPIEGELHRYQLYTLYFLQFRVLKITC